MILGLGLTGFRMYIQGVGLGLGSAKQGYMLGWAPTNSDHKR